MLSPSAQRVPEHTAQDVNRRIERQSRQRIRDFASSKVSPLDQRIEQLENEWDIERTLQFNAATVSLAGLALGKMAHPGFYALPALVAGFFLQHALQGWCPPVPFFRRRGVRTVHEIERERQALKVLRGDYAGQDPLGAARR